MSRQSGLLLDPTSMSIWCVFLTVLNTGATDFCHSACTIPKYAIMSLLSSCEPASASFREWLQCSTLPLNREILINTEIVTHGLCIVWHCLAWSTKCRSVHIYIRSVPQETAEREQRFWWLMKREIVIQGRCCANLVTEHIRVRKMIKFAFVIFYYTLLSSLQHKVPQRSTWSPHAIDFFFFHQCAKLHCDWNAFIKGVVAWQLVKSEPLTHSWAIDTYWIWPSESEGRRNTSHQSFSVKWRFSSQWYKLGTPGKSMLMGSR